MNSPAGAAVLPSRNEPATITAVTRAVDTALENPRAVIVHADSSDHPATAAHFTATPTRSRKISLTGLPRGKGAQILHALHHLPPIHGPVLIADTDTRNPHPALYRALLDNAGTGCAIADYPRHWDEANLTQHLARPLIAAATGWDIPQPLAGDLALNPATLTAARTTAKQLDPQLVAAANGYGIDALLLLAAARTTATITPVSWTEPKTHAASFPHLPQIYAQAVPVLLALPAAWPTPPELTAHQPLYRLADRDLTTERRATMNSTLLALAPPQLPLRCFRVAPAPRRRLVHRQERHAPT